MSRMTLGAVTLSLLATASAPGAQQSTPSEVLDGVDVVILVQQGKEVFGKSAHRASHGGLDYLFSSPETQTAFETSHEKYAVQMGGLCARMGGTVTGNPSNYVLGKEARADECRDGPRASAENLRLAVHREPLLSGGREREFPVFVKDDQPASDADQRGARDRSIPPEHLAGRDIDRRKRHGTEVAVRRVHPLPGDRKEVVALQLGR